MEYFDTYTVLKEKTGKRVLRGTQMPPNTYRYVIHVLVRNEKGEILIQKRQANKESFPNCWDFSVSGSVIAGETSQEGAMRELYEELGIRADLTNTSPFMSFTRECYFIDYYIVDHFCDHQSIKIQTEEVSDIKWVNKDTLQTLMKTEKFIPYVFLPVLWDLIDKDVYEQF